MQRTSRPGEIGAAVRAQPERTANSRNESLESAYFVGNSQDRRLVVLSDRRPDYRHRSATRSCAWPLTAPRSQRQPCVCPPALTR